MSLIDKYFSSFESPGYNFRRLEGQLLNIPVYRWCHPKFDPQPGQELNPGPPDWQPEILPIALTLHVQCECICFCKFFAYTIQN